MLNGKLSNVVKLFLVALSVALVFSGVAGISSVSAGDETPPPSRDGCDPASSEFKPAAQYLANRYNVTYEEIMTWYCQGYGFGEIALAYEISLATDYAVEELFAMREQGLGWGEILLEIGLFMLPPAIGRVDIPVPPATYGRRMPVRIICVDPDYQAYIQELAEKYGLPYDQIYAMFCESDDPATVQDLLALAQQLGLTMDQIRELGLFGKEWKQIWPGFDSGDDQGEPSSRLPFVLPGSGLSDDLPRDGRPGSIIPGLPGRGLRP